MNIILKELQVTHLLCSTYHTALSICLSLSKKLRNCLISGKQAQLYTRLAELTNKIHDYPGIITIYQDILHPAMETITNSFTPERRREHNFPNLKVSITVRQQMVTSSVILSPAVVFLWPFFLPYSGGASFPVFGFGRRVKNCKVSFKLFLRNSLLLCLFRIMQEWSAFSFCLLIFFFFSVMRCSETINHDAFPGDEENWLDI